MNWRAFFQGMGSILDLSGGAYACPRQRYRPMTDEEALAQDARAIASDWEAVGGDFQRAFEKLKRER